MPLPNQKPVGGFRVVYEYAERLSVRGHNVTIYYPVFVPILKYRYPFLLRYIKALANKKKIARWYGFKNKIFFKVIPRIGELYIEDSDIIVATAVPTAYEIKNIKQRKGDKYYLIQHYEIWDGVELANKSYRLGLKNIVIARWLENKLYEVGAPVEAYIPNAIDQAKYFIKNEPELRNRYRIASIYHEDPSKGFKDALYAIMEIKKRYPVVEVTLFSVYKRPKWLPTWIKYIYNPDQKQIVDIYNQAAIFISSSITEGFGLPGMEALACGCALASTDSLGVREYAVNNKTALLSDPENPKDLAKNIIKLIEDDNLRCGIAKRGKESIKRFNWDDNVSKLESLFEKKRCS